jgi:RimJ/RimL family protein N-acetyltransferase
VGERIYFRPIELDDEPLLRTWINDPHTWSTLGHRPPVNACREREWIESLGKRTTDYHFGIVVKEGNRLIGTTGLHRVSPIDRSATFGIMIGDREYRNKGYGSEATKLAVRYGFEELNLNRIALSVFDHNPAAIRAYRKAGFLEEGCLRQAFYRHGRFHDEYRLAILRQEWES